MRSFSARQLAGSLLTLGLLGDWVLFEILRVTLFKSSDAIFLHGGLSQHGIGAFEIWQPLSYAFFHSGWAHLAMNGLLLLSVGSRLEWMVGRRSYLLLLLAGVLLGGLFHLAFSTNILVGGSGAVFALVLAMTTLAPDSKWLMPFPVSAKNLGRGLLTASLILLLTNPDLGIPGLSRLGVMLTEAGWGGLFRISHACHLGGAVAGWLGARWILRTRISLADLQRDRARRESADES